MKMNSHIADGNIMRVMSWYRARAENAEHSHKYPRGYNAEVRDVFALHCPDVIEERELKRNSGHLKSGEQSEPGAEEE